MSTNQVFQPKKLTSVKVQCTQFMFYYNFFKMWPPEILTQPLLSVICIVLINKLNVQAQLEKFPTASYTKEQIILTSQYGKRTVIIKIRWKNSTAVSEIDNWWNLDISHGLFLTTNFMNSYNILTSLLAIKLNRSICDTAKKKKQRAFPWLQSS